MKIFAFGSSLVSSYWNGAATYYRGCYKYLARLGYSITFAEPDAYGRQQHIDAVDLSFARSLTYQPRVAPPGSDPLHRPLDNADPSGRSLDSMLALAREADIVIKHSGIGCDDAELERRIPAELASHAMTFIWDVDAPATIHRMRSDPADALALACPGYDAILTYGGGPLARSGYRAFGARAYFSMYNGLDPDTHHPVPPDPSLACDVVFLGNRLPDREARVEELFLRAAQLAPESSFLLGGEGWHGKQLPPNVRSLGHVPTADHNRVNCSASLVLNINRASMADFGFSPPTRVFEVAGSASAMLCDDWPGIADCFDPNPGPNGDSQEILVVKSAEDVVAALTRYTLADRQRIGQAFHARGLLDHTYAQRAAQAHLAFTESLARRQGKLPPQTESRATVADWAQVPGWRDLAAQIATSAVTQSGAAQ